MEHELKVGDVFGFRWNALHEKHILEHSTNAYHCFDGQLVAKQWTTGIVLEDTYWSSNNKVFTFEQWRGKGELTFKFNINEIDIISENELRFYADEDLFDFCYQHHSYRRFAKRKGAERSAAKMITMINKKISDEENTIRRATSEVKYLKEQIAKVEAGDTTIHF